MPPTPLDEDTLWRLLHEADELGVRLEVVGDALTWEGVPGFRHQEIVGRVQESFDRPTGSESVCVAGVYVRFPSGVVKRPDIAIFCRRPEQEEGFVRMAPEAVVEITSPEYEEKDLVSGPPLYLANGVKDVVVLQRSTGLVHHWTATGSCAVPSPVTIELVCGCRVVV